MTARYLDLADYISIASGVTGLDTTTVIDAADLNLADSALHAPAAGFGGTDHYPDLIDKAAVLICRLAWNHPLPDGNKRTAWACLRMFLSINDVTWTTTPTVDDAEHAVLAIAAKKWNEAEAASWLRSHLHP